MGAAAVDVDGEAAGLADATALADAEALGDAEALAETDADGIAEALGVTGGSRTYLIWPIPGALP